jgi:hypothetical protein
VLLALASGPDDARALFGDAEAGAKDVLLGLCGFDPDAETAPDAGADDARALAAPLPGAVSFFAPDAADALAEAVRLARRHGGRVRASHLFFALCRGDPVRAALRSVPGGAAFARDASEAEERALAEEGGPAPPVDLDPALLAVVSVAMAAAAAKGRARVLGSDLLLALLVDEGPGARALRDAGVDLAALREVLEER